MALLRSLCAATITLSLMWLSVLMACLPSLDPGTAHCGCGTCRREGDSGVRENAE